MGAELDTYGLITALALVGMLAFLLGLAMDGIMDREGFGPLGNMSIIAGGFFLGFGIANHYGIILGDLTMASATGLAGAFLALGLLALLKALLSR